MLGLGGLVLFLRNPGALEAHHVYYTDLHKEVGLLHTIEQGGRIIIYNYTRRQGLWHIVESRKQG